MKKIIAPSVTVVTRTKNRVLLLERAINSVLNQKFSNWRHIIVNDGGDVEAVEVLISRYRHLYEGRIQVVHNAESLTMESASNAGLALADSEYFCIHDDDDSWEDTFLSEMVSCLDEHGQDSKVGGCISYATVIMEDVQDGLVTENSRHFFSDYEGLSYFSMVCRNWFPPICFLVRTAVLKKIGYFDGGLPVLGDWDFNMRFMRHFDLVVYKKPLANYHHRASAVGSFSNSVYGENDKHKYYRSVLLDREIKSSLENGTLDQGSLAVMALLAQRITELESLVERTKQDTIWEIKSHLNWIMTKSGN